MTTRKLDNVDRHLIALLESNARESVTNIAKALGIARTTVNERMARLERDGTIRGYTVMLNRNPFEEYVQCYLLLEIERRTQNTTINFLKRFPEIKLCQVVAGECDLVCSCEVAHLEDLEDAVGRGRIGDGNQEHSIDRRNVDPDRSSRCRQRPAVVPGCGRHRSRRSRLMRMVFLSPASPGQPMLQRVERRR